MSVTTKQTSHSEEPMTIQSAPLYVTIDDNDDDDPDPDATAERRRYVGPMWKCWLLSSGTFFLLLLWPALGLALMGGMIVFDNPNPHGMLVSFVLYFMLLGFPFVLLVSVVTMCRGYFTGRLNRAVKCSFVPVGWFAVIVALWLVLVLLAQLFPY
jgi:hypothetical protein